MVETIRPTIAAAVLVALVGSGCSFQSVYGTHPADQRTTGMVFDLAEPTTRLEQIVYQDLALRFATSDRPGTPELKIIVASAGRDPSLSATPPTLGNGTSVGTGETYEVTVTVTAVVLDGAEELFKATRVSTALYTSTGISVLADQSAAQNAEQQATTAVAESLRLALLARFRG